MKSVRTPVEAPNRDNFRAFLDHAGLQDVKIGIYHYVDTNTFYATQCLCYMYSEKSSEIVAILTYISLKYGNIHNAYKQFMNELYNSSINDPYFTWTP